jgi:uncharacterized protein (DUF1499 family)
MAWIKVILGVLVALPVLLLAAGQLGLLRGTAPADLGVKDGRLKAPSNTRNSASSQAGLWPEHPQLAYARIEPLAQGAAAAAAWNRLKPLLEKTPGTRVVGESENYLRAECSTRLLKFTDDVEFWFDRSAAVLHARSASRLGREDFGANRARLDALRSALAAP